MVSEVVPAEDLPFHGGDERPRGGVVDARTDPARDWRIPARRHCAVKPRAEWVVEPRARSPSITVARYSFPAAVGILVMSHADSRVCQWCL